MLNLLYLLCSGLGAKKHQYNWRLLIAAVHHHISVTWHTLICAFCLALFVHILLHLLVVSLATMLDNNDWFSLIFISPTAVGSLYSRLFLGCLQAECICSICSLTASNRNTDFMSQASYCSMNTDYVHVELVHSINYSVLTSNQRVPWILPD